MHRSSRRRGASAERRSRLPVVDLRRECPRSPTPTRSSPRRGSGSRGPGDVAGVEASWREGPGPSRRGDPVVPLERDDVDIVSKPGRWIPKTWIVPATRYAHAPRYALHGFVGEAHVLRRAVDVRVDGDRADRRLVAATDDVHGDLAPVGDEDLVEGCLSNVSFPRGRTRNPSRPVCRRGVLAHFPPGQHGEGNPPATEWGCRARSP
jgi:hypothetical protein